MTETTELWISTSHPSPSSTGSFIRRRKSAWCSWINRTSCGFCFPSSWSIGCREHRMTQSQENIGMDTPKRCRNELNSQFTTCKIWGLACTTARKAWNWEKVLFTSYNLKESISQTSTETNRKQRLEPVDYCVENPSCRHLHSSPLLGDPGRRGTIKIIFCFSSMNISIEVIFLPVGKDLKD